MMVITSNKREKHNVLERVITLLLCSLGVTYIITFITLYSPNPFQTAASKPQLHQNSNLLIIQPPINEEGILMCKKKTCDLFKGRWVPDLNGSMYTSTSCSWIPEWKNCFKHGRRDVDFVNWRWKPDECEIPRFDPQVFLRIAKDKRMVFIGDSLARNQLESLLCLLSQVAAPREIDKDDQDEKTGPRTLYFSSHNFTIMFLRSIFLVHSEEIIINGSSSGTYNIHLDKADNKWVHSLTQAHYAIISGVHWFFRKNYLYEHGQRIGCVHCSEPNVTDLGLTFAIRKALKTAIGSINGCHNCTGLATVLRTFSPAHFENGTWNGGGYCNKTRPMEKKEVDLVGFEWELRSAQVGEIERVKMEGAKGGKRFEVLDVTRAMLMRPDGHPGLHWDNKWMKGVSDCLHWCLPGPIDVWNDLLLMVLLRMETCSPHGSESNAD